MEVGGVNLQKEVLIYRSTCDESSQSGPLPIATKDKKSLYSLLKYLPTMSKENNF